MDKNATISATTILLLLLALAVVTAAVIAYGPAAVLESFTLIRG